MKIFPSDMNLLTVVMAVPVPKGICVTINDTHINAFIYHRQLTFNTLPVKRVIQEVTRLSILWSFKQLKSPWHFRKKKLRYALKQYWLFYKQLQVNLWFGIIKACSSGCNVLVFYIKICFCKCIYMPTWEFCYSLHITSKCKTWNFHECKFGRNCSKICYCGAVSIKHPKILVMYLVPSDHVCSMQRVSTVDTMGAIWVIIEC